MSAPPFTRTSPQARLARTRAAFAAALGDPRHPVPASALPQEQCVAAHGTPEAGPAGGLPSWELLHKGLRAWWQAHPARVAVQVAEPAFRELARERPWPVLGVAAGLGAALVCIRPWRLATAGALAAVALRPVSVSSLLVGLMTTLAEPHPPPTRPREAANS